MEPCRVTTCKDSIFRLRRMSSSMVCRLQTTVLSSTVTYRTSKKRESEPHFSDRDGVISLVQRAPEFQRTYKAII